jgi:hypothetical protein
VIQYLLSGFLRLDLGAVCKPLQVGQPKNNEQNAARYNHRTQNYID